MRLPRQRRFPFIFDPGCSLAIRGWHGRQIARLSRHSEPKNTSKYPTSCAKNYDWLELHNYRPNGKGRHSGTEESMDVPTDLAYINTQGWRRNGQCCTPAHLTGWGLRLHQLNRRHSKHQAQEPAQLSQLCQQTYTANHVEPRISWYPAKGLPNA